MLPPVRRGLEKVQKGAFIARGVGDLTLRILELFSIFILVVCCGNGKKKKGGDHINNNEIEIARRLGAAILNSFILLNSSDLINLTTSRAVLRH